MVESNKTSYDIVIVGGLGHVGLPLGLVFANKEQHVCLYDINSQHAEIVKKGNMPFVEYESEPILNKVLKNGKLEISLDINDVSKARYVIIAVGTPVDEYLNPKTRQFLEFSEAYRVPKQRSDNYSSALFSLILVSKCLICWVTKMEISILSRKDRSGICS